MAVIATSIATMLVARRLSTPTAKPLFAVCLLLVATAVSQVAVLAPSPVRSILAAKTGVQLPGEYWAALALILGLPADGLWLLFAVGHTGRGNRLRRQVTAFVVVLVGFYYIAPVYALFQAGAGQSPDIVVSGVLLTGLFFMSPLASLGSLLVLETSLRRNAIPLGEGIALALGGLLFIYAPVVGLNTETPTAIPALLLGASVLLTVAVSKYPLFETLPVARIAARDRLVEEMNDAVLLVDEQARVVELNPAAESLFDVDSAESQRRSLREVFPDAPDPAELAAASEPLRLRTGGTHLEVTASHVVGEYKTSVGYLVVCRDVTEQGRRERRLRVLTQFLAETVGERTTTIARRAGQIADGDEDADYRHRPGDGGDPAALAGTICRTTESLKRFVSATRRIERALSDHDAGPSDVVAVVREVATERKSVALTVENGAEAIATVDSAVLRAVLELLLEDRLEQSPGHIQITVSSSHDTEPVIEIQLRSPVDDEEQSASRDSVLAQREEMKAKQNRSEEPIIALCRLALEHAGGTIESSTDPSLNIRLRANQPTSPADSSISDGPEKGTSRDHPSHAENVGEQL